MTIEFNEQVAIVTGAGGGLGKTYAMQLAARGAKVVVNDFGGNRDGSGGAAEAADTVVAEIKAAGGQAFASYADVTDVAQVENMVSLAQSAWGRVDILINNAGILRNHYFEGMPDDDWNAVVDVHLNGTARCCRAVWSIMSEQQYGRIVMTTSSAGIYGIAGQANFAAAKFGVVGLMNVLSLEGRKHNIYVNSIAPLAATRLTEDVMTKRMLEQIPPEDVTPAVLFLSSKDAPNHQILLAGAGTYTVAKLVEAEGIKLPPAQRTAENVAAIFNDISNVQSGVENTDGMQHIERIIKKEIDPFG